MLRIRGGRFGAGRAHLGCPPCFDRAEAPNGERDEPGDVEKSDDAGAGVVQGMLAIQATGPQRIPVWFTGTPMSSMVPMGDRDPERGDGDVVETTFQTGLAKALP